MFLLLELHSQASLTTSSIGEDNSWFPRIRAEMHCCRSVQLCCWSWCGQWWIGGLNCTPHWLCLYIYFFFLFIVKLFIVCQGAGQPNCDIHHRSLCLFQHHAALIWNNVKHFHCVLTGCIPITLSVNNYCYKVLFLHHEVAGKLDILGDVSAGTDITYENLI